MAYNKTTWVNGETRITAEKLNNIEEELTRISGDATEALDSFKEVEDAITAINNKKEMTLDRAVIGKRGPVGPPNSNNLYVAGAIYTMPPEEAYTVTGPGAKGGNVFLPNGGAVCGFTKDGPVENEDGTRDSGIRTIGFVGQVSEEDKANNEDSVYLGTNISRMYLYSRTAFPTIVSNKTIFMRDNGSVPVTEENATEHVNEEVQTISPMATQEWTMEMLDSLGIIGGQVDTTDYSVCSPNLPTSFDVTKSMQFMDQWQRKHNWNLGTNGTVSVSGSDSSAYVPLLQKTGWNDIYMDLTSINSSDIEDTYFVLYHNPEFVFAISFDKNTYSLTSFSKYGKRSGEYNYGIKLDVKKLVAKNTLLRYRYDKDNESAVFSLVNSQTGSEEQILTISKYAFSGMHMFTHPETVECFGFGCQVRNGDHLPTVVDKPASFTHNREAYVSDYAVVRQKDLAVTVEQMVERRLITLLSQKGLI